jgi:hypothetical protein
MEGVSMDRSFRRKNTGKDRGAYEDFDATELLCLHCKVAVPVLKKLFLILPEGEKYVYLCSRCGREVGEKLVTIKEQDAPIIYST